MESLTDLSWIHSLWGESYLIQLPRYLFPHTLRHTATMLSKYLRIFSNISQFLTQICCGGGILSDTTSRYLFPHTLRHTATMLSKYLRIFSNISQFLTQICFWGEILSDTTSKYLFSHTSHSHNIFKLFKNILKYLQVIDQNI